MQIGCGDIAMTSERFIRICVILLLLLSSISETTFSQDHKSTSPNGVNTISLTLTEAIDFALRANRNLLQSGYSLQNQQLSLESTWSEFDLRATPFSRVGVADGEGIIKLIIIFLCLGLVVLVGAVSVLIKNLVTEFEHRSHRELNGPMISIPAQRVCPSAFRC